jgi:ABC-type proline/glycine betaine transport system permease subunit
MGAIPSAILAICIELLFDAIDKLLTYPHLRQKN